MGVLDIMMQLSVLLVLASWAQFFLVLEFLPPFCVSALLLVTSRISCNEHHAS